MEDESIKQIVAFGQWVTHNDFTYLPSKGYWVNEEEDYTYTNEQIYEKYLNSTNNERKF